jgi:hypothetical protein
VHRSRDLASISFPRARSDTRKIPIFPFIFRFFPFSRPFMGGQVLDRTTFPKYFPFI